MSTLWRRFVMTTCRRPWKMPTRKVLHADRRGESALHPGAYVLGEYLVEVIQHGGGIHGPRNAVVRVAEPHLAYPIFTEAVGPAAHKLVRMQGMVPLMPTAGAIEPLYT